MNSPEMMLVTFVMGDGRMDQDLIAQGTPFLRVDEDADEAWVWLASWPKPLPADPTDLTVEPFGDKSARLTGLFRNLLAYYIYAFYIAATTMLSPYHEILALKVMLDKAVTVEAGDAVTITVTSHRQPDGSYNRTVTLTVL